MQIRRLIVVLALCVVGSSAPSRAFDGPCHQEKQRGDSKSCTVPFKQTPITVYAETTGTNVSIHVWVKVSGYPEMPPLVECSKTGSGFFSCGTAFPDSTTKVSLSPHPAVPTLTLVCTFEGTGDWKFGCDAGK